ncbi:MAG: UDP-N-acetylmuramate dehydrogenase [Parcubacteria group bacterium]
MIKIQKNIPLAPYTTFCIGGPAKCFVEASSEEELIESLQYAKKNKLNFFILGGGSNVLISDDGFDGLIIKIQNTKYNIQNTTIEAGAGTSIAKLIKISTENGLTGLEWVAGIPGVVGGAVRGNAGAFGSCMQNSIESVKVVDTRKMQTAIYNKEGCKFSYRSSVFKENPQLVILSITLKLNLGDKNKIQNKVKEIIKMRNLNHPKENSAGSFFKNPIIENNELVEKFERDQSIKCKDNKIPAGWLIDQVGLKGKKIGGAMVSEKHANFIVNTGGATAEDVIMLSCLVKQQVRDKFGIELKEEVQLIGF